ncbi:hypothetical protein COSO111634_33035 [Corallococcus soli]
MKNVYCVPTMSAAALMAVTRMTVPTVENMPSISPPRPAPRAPPGGCAQPLSLANMSCESTATLHVSSAREMICGRRRRSRLPTNSTTAV